MKPRLCPTCEQVIPDEIPQPWTGSLLDETLAERVRLFRCLSDLWYQRKCRGEHDREKIARVGVETFGLTREESERVRMCATNGHQYREAKLARLRKKYGTIEPLRVLSAA